MKNVEEGDYVIAKYAEEKKTFLAKVSSVDGDQLIGRLEANVAYKSVSVEFKADDVKLNLGPKPFPGTVHGFDLNNLYRKTITHDWWGNIHLMTKVEKSVMSSLKKSLDTTGKKLDKMGLKPFVELIETELRSPKGKYAGMYIHSRTESGIPNRVWYAPRAGAESQGVMDYVVFHEFGHVVRFNGVLLPKLKARWLALYQSSIAPLEVSEKRLDSIFKRLKGQDPDSSFKAALKDSLEGQHPRTGNALLQWFKQTHRMTPRELSIVWEDGGAKAIREYWPAHVVDTHDLKPVITDYAVKNVEETFAETFAFYCLGRKIPEKFASLMEESISVAKVTVGT